MLRDAGYSVEMDYQGRSLKAQFKTSDRLNSKVIIIVGEDECGNKTAQVKDVANKTQETVEFARLSETVGNIFFPNSPLHDGAVIVRDGRLYAAGGILPLTHNTGISSQLGTRHRAAIGMTENSDAVVLVVSEETGVISIAYNGNITRNHSVASAYSEIKSMLVDLYEEKPKNSVKSIFKKTIGAIIPKINNKKKEDNSNEN